MKIKSLRMVGMRCFEDTTDLMFDDRFNIFVGKNNAGKSTLLKAIYGLQISPLHGGDVRPSFEDRAFITVNIDGLQSENGTNNRNINGKARINALFSGRVIHDYGNDVFNIGAGDLVLSANRPTHTIIPFFAKRKAVAFSHDVSSSAQTLVTGTMTELYARIDLLATSGHPKHDLFRESVRQIIGLDITTAPSNGGKQAGYYYNEDKFIPLDSMGDGVSEMAALIVELCLEKNKIFVLEEPETNLHPQGLKALLALVREASEHNQFFIATHSNVVVRELNETGKVFRVFRDGDAPTSPSKVEEVQRSPQAHIDLLRELGYEFTDFNLYDGWLFLEESSAESVISKVLIPMFEPKLSGRLRTYSAAGASNVEPSVSEFRRLIVFVHLQHVYKGRFWVRVDADDEGLKALEKLKSKFKDDVADSFESFTQPQFEKYYPSQFQDEANRILAIPDKGTRLKEKAELLKKVLQWTNDNKVEALAAWQQSASELIELLQSIRNKLEIN